MPCKSHTARRMSSRTELILINLICFGLFTYGSAMRLWRRETTLIYDDHRLYTVVGIELAAALLAILILRRRGWTLADFGLRPSLLDPLAGIVLFFGTMFLISFLYELIRAATGTDPDSATTAVIRTTWPAVIVLVVVNPLFEELFEVAYNIRATERDGAAFGITFSAIVRFVCHLYQGPIAAITILPIGLIFAAVYWRWRRLWPLVIAHAVMDVYGLAPGQ